MASWTKMRCSEFYIFSRMLVRLVIFYLPAFPLFLPPPTSPSRILLLSTIMAAANILTSPPRVRHCQTLSKWLQLLNLSHLEGHFEGYPLRKIASFWDVQLTTVRQSESTGQRFKCQLVLLSLCCCTFVGCNTFGVER